MKKYYRFLGIPLSVVAIYYAGWIAYRPKVWHDLPDAIMCFLVTLAAWCIATMPFDWPWEEK